MIRDRPPPGALCGRLDYITKYDFYGLLAQAALDYLERNRGKAELKGMLLEVIAAAKRFEL